MGKTSIIDAMCGDSYNKRMKNIIAIYEEWARRGLKNRDIWRWHIYPEYGISERTFYNYLKKSKKH